MPDKIKEAYDAIKDSKIFTDESDFRSQVSKDPKGVFDLFNEEEETKGLFTSIDDFNNQLGLKKKEEPVAYAPKSTTGGEAGVSGIPSTDVKPYQAREVKVKAAQEPVKAAAPAPSFQKAVEQEQVESKEFKGPVVEKPGGPAFAKVDGISFDKSAFQNYEQTQSALKRADDDASRINIPGATMGGFASPEGMKAIGERIQVAQKQKQQIRPVAEAAYKKLGPEISDLTEKTIGDKGVDYWTTISDTGDRIPDVNKINEWSKKITRESGISDEGFAKKILYNSMNSAVSYALEKPEIDKKQKELFKKNYGMDLDSAVQADYLSKFKEAEKIKDVAGKQAKEVASSLQNERKEQSDMLFNEYSPIIENTKLSYTEKAQKISSDITNLNNLYQRGMIDKVEYSSQFEQYKSAMNALDKTSQAEFNDIITQYQKRQNELNGKFDRRYKRQLDEIDSMAKGQLAEAASKYGKEYKMSPELETKLKKTYEAASKQYRAGEDFRKYLMDQTRGFASTLKNSLLSGLGDGIKTTASFFNLDGAYVYGDALSKSKTLSSAEIDSAIDLLDPIKLARSAGQMVGAQGPAFAVQALVGFATRGQSVLTQLAIEGALGFASDNIQTAGQMYDDVFLQTGSVEKANNAAKESIKGNTYLLPLYAIDGLPFIEKATLGIKNELARAAAKGVVETAKEIPQEYFQNEFEDLIKNNKSLGEVWQNMSMEKLGKTALNVIPGTFAMGAVPGAAGATWSIAKKPVEYIQGRTSAALVDMSKLSTTSKQQWVYDTFMDRGETFTKALVNALYTGGQINDNELTGFVNIIDQSKAIKESSEKNNLNTAQSKVYGAMMFEYAKAKNEAATATDDVTKKAAEDRMKSAEENAAEYLNTKKGSFAILTMANGSKYIYSYNTMEDILNGSKVISEQLQKGEAKLEVVSQGKNKDYSGLENRYKEIMSAAAAAAPTGEGTEAAAAVTPSAPEVSPEIQSLTTQKEELVKQREELTRQREETLAKEKEEADKKLEEIKGPIKKAVGTRVSYQGIEGVLDVDSDNNYVVVADDGEEHIVEGGLSGKTPTELGLKKAPEKPVVEISETQTEPIPDSEILYDFNTGKIRLYGNDYEYVGIETDDKGNTTAVKVKDNKGNIKFIRNADAVFEIEMQKMLAEDQNSGQYTVDDLTQIAQENGIEPETKTTEAPEAGVEEVQQGEPGEAPKAAPKEKKSAAIKAIDKQLAALETQIGEIDTKIAEAGKPKKKEAPAAAKEKAEGKKRGRPSKKAAERVEGVSASNTEQLNELANKYKDDTVKSKIIEAVKRGLKTLRSILPDMDIVILESEADFDAYVTQEGKPESKGIRATALYMAYKGTGKATGEGVIAINLSKANARSVAHEIAHMVLAKAFGSNVQLFADFKNKVSGLIKNTKVVSEEGDATTITDDKGNKTPVIYKDGSWKKLENGNYVSVNSSEQKQASKVNENKKTSLIKELEAFTESPIYTIEDRPEEFLVELAGYFSQGQNVPVSLMTKIAALINEFVSKITKGRFQPFEGVASAKRALEFFQTIGQAVAKGEELRLSEKQGGKGPVVSISKAQAIGKSMPMSAANVLYSDSDVLPKPEKKISNSAVAFKLQEIAQKYWGGEIITSDTITPEQENIIINNGVAEAVSALKASGKNAADWYSTAIEVAINVASIIHPELSSVDAASKYEIFAKEKDPVAAAQLALRMALAITSQNLNVEANTKYAEEQFEFFKTNGKFDPSKTYGEKGASISSNLNLANELIEAIGLNDSEQFIKKEFTVAELEEEAKKIIGKKVKISGLRNDVINGAALFGPKIGQGFLQNLMGKFDPVTIDLWMRRTWGRWTGDVVGDGINDIRMARFLNSFKQAAKDLKIKTPEVLKKHKPIQVRNQSNKLVWTMPEAFMEELDSDPKYREELNNLVKDISLKANEMYKLIRYMPMSQKMYEEFISNKKSYADIANEQKAIKTKLSEKYIAYSDAERSKGRKPKLKNEWLAEQYEKTGKTKTPENDEISERKPEWAKAAKTIISDLNPLDIPSNQDRRVITRVVNEIRKGMEGQGYVVTNADVQAILWYPEKDIWAKLRGETVLTEEEQQRKAILQNALKQPENNKGTVIVNGEELSRSDVEIEVEGLKESNLKTSYDDQFIKIAKERGLGKQAEKVAEETRSRRSESARSAYEQRADEGVYTGTAKAIKAAEGVERKGKAQATSTAKEVLSSYEKGTTINLTDILARTRGKDPIIKEVLAKMADNFNKIKISGKRPTEGAAFYNRNTREIDVNKNSEHWDQVETDAIESSLAHEFVHHLINTNPEKAAIEKELEGIKKDLIASKPELNPDQEYVYDFMVSEKNSPQEILTYAISDPVMRPLLSKYAPQLNKIINQVVGEGIIKSNIFEPQKIETYEERTGRPQQAGDRGGRVESRTIAPLEGAPSVPGVNGPDPQLVAVAEQYARENGIPLKRQSEYVKVDVSRAKRIAEAYAEMKHDPQNPKVKEAYKDLIKQTIAQYEALRKAGYKFWFIDTNIPSNKDYAETPFNALRDIRKNKEMGVFPTTDGFGSSDLDVSDNPLMEETKYKWPVGGMDGELKPVLANDLFRAVHDAFGHGLEGAAFRARGEENAWQAHVRLFTGSAIGAITSETRGQNSWLNFNSNILKDVVGAEKAKELHPDNWETITVGEHNSNAKTDDTIFADQKTGLMPEWTWTEGRAGDMQEGVEKKTKFQRAGVDPETADIVQDYINDGWTNVAEIQESLAELLEDDSIELADQVASAFNQLAPAEKIDYTPANKELFSKFEKIDKAAKAVQEYETAVGKAKATQKYDTTVGEAGLSQQEKFVEDNFDAIVNDLKDKGILNTKCK